MARAEVTAAFAGAAMLEGCAADSVGAGERVSGVAGGVYVVERESAGGCVSLQTQENLGLCGRRFSS